LQINSVDSCQRLEVCLQINIQNLKDRDRWASGWLQRSEVEAMNDLGATCQVCVSLQSQRERSSTGAACTAAGRYTIICAPSCLTWRTEELASEDSAVARSN